MKKDSDDSDTIHLGQAAAIIGWTPDWTRRQADLEKIACGRDSHNRRTFSRAECMAIAQRRAEERAAIEAIRERHGAGKAVGRGR
jgi:hypothetical protein